MGKWITVAPFWWYVDRGGVLKAPFAMAGNVVIGPVPAWIRDSSVTKHLSAAHRTHLETDARAAFSCDYSARRFGDRHPASSRDRPLSKQDWASRLIRLANIALWLAQPSAIGYEILFHFERSDDRELLRQTQWMNPIRPHAADEHTQLSNEDLESAAALHAALVGLSGSSLLLSATRYLYKGLTEALWESRYVFLWIVMESLFGPEDAREMTYRLSHRVAQFLEESPEERRQTFQWSKGAYAWRSKLVHGARLRRLQSEQSGELMHGLERLIRRSITTILSDPSLTKAFNSNRREVYLDDLMFR